MTISDAEWLALLFCTEESVSSYWPLIGWPVRLRVEANRKIFGGDTYGGVITQPYQFSRFNGIVGTQVEIYERVKRYYSERQLEQAWHCASWLLSQSRHECPLPDKTFYFWSPQSMIPAGTLPQWDWPKLKRFCCPGVDPWRLLHAREWP